MTRRQAILTVLSTPMAQFSSAGEPSTLTVDLSKWEQLVVVRGSVRITYTAKDIINALLSPN